MKPTIKRPQDLVFSKAELDKAFGPRLTREQYLQSLKTKFDVRDEENEEETR